jgi:uncharacterized protein DUF4238
VTLIDSMGTLHVDWDDGSTLGLVWESGDRWEVVPARWWTVEHDRKAGFITSDAPVVVWRTPTPRDRFEGFGDATADEIRLPLDPAKQLVVTTKTRTASARVSSERVRACNADMTDGCHEYVIGPPGSRELHASHLSARKPVLRFNTGPLYKKTPDGRERLEGEVVHMWVPRR